MLLYSLLSFSQPVMYTHPFPKKVSLLGLCKKSAVGSIQSAQVNISQLCHFGWDPGSVGEASSLFAPWLLGARAYCLLIQVLHIGL